MQQAVAIEVNAVREPVGERRWRLRGSDSAAVAARLVELRLAFGYRYSVDWARHLAIHPTTLANYESGTRMITVPAALKYAQKTGASLDWIYRGLDYSLPANVQEKLTRYREGNSDGPRPHR